MLLASLKSVYSKYSAKLYTKEKRCKNNIGLSTECLNTVDDGIDNKS